MNSVCIFKKKYPEDSLEEHMDEMFELNDGRLMNSLKKELNIKAQYILHIILRQTQPTDCLYIRVLIRVWNSLQLENFRMRSFGDFSINVFVRELVTTIVEDTK